MVNHFIGINVVNIVDRITTWCVGWVPIILIVLLWVIGSGKNNDDTDSTGGTNALNPIIFLTTTEVIGMSLNPTF